MDDRTSTTSTQPGATATEPASTAQTGTVPIATAPAATTPPDDAGGAAAPPEPEAAEGGAGDEEGIRVPVDLRVSADGVTPATVTVPAFLPVELTARSADGRSHDVTVAGTALAVPAEGSVTSRIDGLRRGTYPIEVDGRARGSLVAGDEPGP